MAAAAVNSALAFGQGLAAGMPGEATVKCLIVGEIKRMYIWMVQRRMGSAFGLPRLVMIGDWQR